MATFGNVLLFSRSSTNIQFGVLCAVDLMFFYCKCLAAFVFIRLRRRGEGGCRCSNSNRSCDLQCVHSYAIAYLEAMGNDVLNVFLLSRGGGGRRDNVCFVLHPCPYAL